MKTLISVIKDIPKDLRRSTSLFLVIILGNICGEQRVKQGFDNALPIDIYERFRRVDGYGQHAASESACK